MPDHEEAMRRKPATTTAATQLEIDFTSPPVWVDPDDIPEPGDYPEHRWADAKDCETPKIKGAVASVFDLAARQVIAEFMLPSRCTPHESPDEAPVIHRRITREGGVTRHIAMREQETEAWQEKERARRARQKLPKPPKQTFKLRKEAA